MLHSSKCINCALIRMIHCIAACNIGCKIGDADLTNYVVYESIRPNWLLFCLRSAYLKLLYNLYVFVVELVHSNQILGIK